jgi:hypothetical protein
MEGEDRDMAKKWHRFKVGDLVRNRQSGAEAAIHGLGYYYPFIGVKLLVKSGKNQGKTTYRTWCVYNIMKT